jgi:ribosomal protein S27E
MDVKCPGCFNITTVFSHAQYALALYNKKNCYKERIC